jgi:hypothetical protein
VILSLIVSSRRGSLSSSSRGLQEPSVQSRRSNSEGSSVYRANGSSLSTLKCRTRLACPLNYWFYCLCFSYEGASILRRWMALMNDEPGMCAFRLEEEARPRECIIRLELILKGQVHVSLLAIELQARTPISSIHPSLPQITDT